MNTTKTIQTGYVFNFDGHGAFAPDGKVEMTKEQIDAHNAKLARIELESMKTTGRAVLYLFHSPCLSVGTWASEPHQRARVERTSHSRNNWGILRQDVWFKADGAMWWGMNIGDNDIVRCKRIKG